MGERLVSKREGQRSLSWSDLFPDNLRLYLTDEDELEAIRRAALEARDVVLSPLLAMELVCDWRNMRAALDAANGRRPDDG